MNKKKLVIMMASMALIGAVGIGATLAYFTDSDMAENTITMGNVDISLLEDNEDITGLTFDHVVPGQVLEKDPKIVLDSESQDAFVRAKVTISGNEMLLNDEYTDEADALDALIEEAIILNGWSENADGYYYYPEKLTQTNNEAILFETLSIPSAWGNLMANKKFYVSIQAEAIQADWLEDDVTISDNVTGDIIGWKSGLNIEQFD